jgi:hypothetical protein
MMRRLILVLLSAFFLTISISCTNCANLDCISSDLLSIKFVSEGDGENLLSGNPPEINEEALDITAQRDNGDRITIDLALSGNAVYPQLKENFKKYYITALNKTDTLDLTFSMRDTECCGKITNITAMTINDVPVSPQYSDYWEITLYR